MGDRPPAEGQKAQVKDRTRKPICKRDAAGHAETVEMDAAAGDYRPHVRRGQPAYPRPAETAETEEYGS